MFSEENLQEKLVELAILTDGQKIVRAKPVLPKYIQAYAGPERASVYQVTQLISEYVDQVLTGNEEKSRALENSFLKSALDKEQLESVLQNIKSQLSEVDGQLGLKGYAREQVASLFQELQLPTLNPSDLGYLNDLIATRERTKSEVEVVRRALANMNSADARAKQHVRNRYNRYNNTYSNAKAVYQFAVRDSFAKIRNQLIRKRANKSRTSEDVTKLDALEAELKSIIGLVDVEAISDPEFLWEVIETISFFDDQKSVQTFNYKLSKKVQQSLDDLVTVKPNQNCIISRNRKERYSNLGTVVYCDQRQFQQVSSILFPHKVYIDKDQDGNTLLSVSDAEGLQVLLKNRKSANRAAKKAAQHLLNIRELRAKDSELHSKTNLATERKEFKSAIRWYLKSFAPHELPELRQALEKAYKSYRASEVNLLIETFIKHRQELLG